MADKLYRKLSDVSSGATTLTSLVPTNLFDTSKPNLVALQGLIGDPPTELRIHGGNILVSPSGKPIGVGRTEQIVSMFMNDKYGRLGGKGKQQIQLLKDCGHLDPASTTTTAPRNMVEFMSKGSIILEGSLDIKDRSSGKKYFDQLRSFAGANFMGRLLSYIVDEINKMPPEKRRKFTVMSRDAHWMRVTDSLQVPGSITSIAQLAPPITTLQRTGPKLSEEEELKRLVVTLYELRGIPGLDKGTTVYNFLSFLLRSSVGRCQDKWPGLTLKYQGYVPSTNSSNLLVELLELEVKVYARSIFCLHGGHKFSEKAKASASYKASRKMSGKTQTANFVNEKADEGLVLSDCLPGLAKLCGISAEYMTLTKVGVGECAAEKKALIVALGLFKDGYLDEGLEDVTFGTFITTILNTKWDRVYNMLKRNNSSNAGIKNYPYEHTEDELSSLEKQKELGRLLKEVAAHRESDEYEKQLAKSDGEETSKKKQGKPKATSKATAGSGKRGDSSAKQSASTKKSSSKSTGLKTSSNKANTSSSRKGKKQPKGKKDRPSSSSNAHRGGEKTRQKTGYI